MKVVMNKFIEELSEKRKQSGLTLKDF